jgi:hypothetical protein
MVTLTSFDRSPPRQRIILMLIVILILGSWAFGLTRFDWFAFQHPTYSS